LLLKRWGVTQDAISRWLKRAREGGVEALRTRELSGPTPRLTPEGARIPELLKRRVEAFGFRGDIWTCSRVAEVIRREFGVSYHPAYVSRILSGCRLSRRKPVCRDSRPDEEAVERWRQERWAEVRKRAIEEDSILL